MSISKTGIYYSVTIAVLFAAATSINTQRQMERLGRGVVAVNQGEGKAFVSWRMLGTEPDSIAFNVYRTTGNDQPVELNGQPLTQATCYQDSGVDFSQPLSYTVRPVLNSREQPAGAPFTFPANAPVRQYLSIPLQAGRGVPNDASVGDLNGDGEYEIVLKREDGSRDNSRGGSTGSTTLEAYTLDGTFMWKIDLGRNIRGGAHYTQFMVYDLDGDGKAEVVCKTADGTVDGKGNVIGDAGKNYVNDNGMILDGPEFLTVFEGQTGAALATTDYIPPRGGDGSGWGDNRGNRVDRFLACVAYLDGVRPSVVMCRGYYTRSVLVAWDWRDDKLTQRWVFDSDVKGTGKDGKPNQDYAEQGNHNLSVADVDGDGRDEIVYGACCIDDDGKGLWTTGLRHGDAMHVSDLDPSRSGLEVFGIHEGRRTPGAALLDARTGEVIWKTDNADTSRGLAVDLDPRYPGAECFGGPGGSHNVKGETIHVRGGNNFAIWWDGDLLREILNRNTISKWNWETGEMGRIFTAEGCKSNNGSKATPALSADLFGDWREELIERTTDNKELRIYTTVIPTEHRIYTLMHDPQYRLSIAWQNVAYNQPPHTGFFLGHGMAALKRPSITVTDARPLSNSDAVLKESVKIFVAIIIRP
jgi:rhamnogalacturonan endolyase